MNKCMAEIYKIQTGFDPGKPGRKANTITNELKRILPKALIDYCRLFIVATGYPSERRPRQTVSCYGG